MLRWQGDTLRASLPGTPGEASAVVRRGRPIVHAVSGPAGRGCALVAAATAEAVAFYVLQAPPQGEPLLVKAGEWMLPPAPVSEGASGQALQSLSLSHDGRYTLATTGAHAYILSRPSTGSEADDQGSAATGFASFCPTEAAPAARHAGPGRPAPQLLAASWWHPHAHGAAASFALAGLAAGLGGQQVRAAALPDGTAAGASNHPAVLLLLDSSGRCEVWRETDPWCAPTFTRCLSIQVAEPLRVAPAAPAPGVTAPPGLVAQTGTPPCDCASFTGEGSAAAGSVPSSPTGAVAATTSEACCNTTVYCTHASATWVQRRVAHDRLHWAHAAAEERGGLAYVPPSASESGAAATAAGAADGPGSGDGILALPPVPHTESAQKLAASLAAAASAASSAAAGSKVDNTGMSAPLPKTFMQHTAVSVEELSAKVALSSGSGVAVAGVAAAAGDGSAASGGAATADVRPAPQWPTTGHWKETDLSRRPRAGSLVRSASTASFRVVDATALLGDGPPSATQAAPAAAPEASRPDDPLPTALLLSDSPSGALTAHIEYFLVTEALTRVRTCVNAFVPVAGAGDKASQAPLATEVARASFLRLTLWRLSGVRDVPQRAFVVSKCKVVEVPLAPAGPLAALAAAPAGSCKLVGAVSDVLYRSGGQAVPTLLQLGDGKGGKGSGSRCRAARAPASLPDAAAALACSGGTDALDSFRSIAGQEAVWAAVASSAEEADPALAALHATAGGGTHPSSPALAPMTPQVDGSEGGPATSSRVAVSLSLSSPTGAGRPGGPSQASLSSSSSARASSVVADASAASKLRSRAASALATAVTLDVSAGEWGDPHALLTAADATGSARPAHRTRWWFDGREDGREEATAWAGASSAEEGQLVPASAASSAPSDAAVAAPHPRSLSRQPSCGPTSSMDNTWDVFHRVPARTGARGACVPLRTSEAPQSTRLLIDTGGGAGLDVAVDWESGAAHTLGSVALPLAGAPPAAPSGNQQLSTWQPQPLPALAVSLEPPPPSSQPLPPAHPCMPEGTATKTAIAGSGRLGTEALPQHHPSFLLSCLRNGSPALVSTILAHLAHSLQRAVAWRKVLRAATAREDGRATERRKAKLAALIKSDRSSQAVPSLMTDADTAGLRAQWDDTSVLREEGWWVNDEDDTGAGAQAGEAALMRVAVAPLPASYLLSIASSSASGGSSAPKAPASLLSASLFAPEAAASSGAAAIVPEEDASDASASEDATDTPEWVLAADADGSGSPDPSTSSPYPLRVLRRWYTCPMLYEGVHPDPAALVGLADRWTPGAAEVAPAYHPRLTGPLLACLASHLPNAAIEGLGPGDNLLLLAVIETLRALYGSQRSEAAALDPAGFQFLLSVKLFQVSKRCLSPADRPSGLTWADCAWALQSDSQDALFRLCVPTSLSWGDMLALRLPLWLRSDDHLAEAVTRVATTQFQRSEHDPFACMLPYLALGPAKLPVVRNLFRLSPPHQKVYTFLMNDFAADRWKRAASKNAFALLSQHRHEQAAAFFLLAGRLPQAIKVALMEMKDPALGLTLARLGARPGAGWLAAVSLPPGAPPMGPSARYAGVDATALLREAAQTLLDMKKGVSAKPAAAGSFGGSTGLGGSGGSAAPARPVSILGFGFDDDYDSMPATEAPVAKAPSLLGNYYDDDDDDPTVYRPKAAKAAPNGGSAGKPADAEPEGVPDKPAAIFVDTRPGPAGQIRYCVDTHPVEYVLQMEFLAAATGECTPTPSGAGGAGSSLEPEAAALRYLTCSVLQKPLEATRAFVAAALKAALPPPPAAAADAGRPGHHPFWPSDACPPPPVLRLLKHALAQPQMKNPVVLKVLLAEALAAVSVAPGGHPHSAPAAPTPAAVSAALAATEEAATAPLLAPCLEALVSAALASSLIRSGAGLAACATAAAAHTAFHDKAARALAAAGTMPSMLLAWASHALSVIREAAGIAALQSTASGLQVCIDGFDKLRGACRAVGSWWRLPHTTHAAGVVAVTGGSSTRDAGAAAAALHLPTALEPFARSLLADADAVLPAPDASMAVAFGALANTAGRVQHWATGFLTALLSSGRVPLVPVQVAAASTEEPASDAASPPALYVQETRFHQTWPLRIPLAGCRTAVLTLLRGLMVASQEALTAYFAPHPLLGVHAAAHRLAAAAMHQPECVPCVGAPALAALAGINAKAAACSEALLATHARLGTSMAALIPFLIEAGAHTGVLPPHGWDRFILSTWLHLLVVALVSHDAGLLLRLLTRWMPDRLAGLPTTGSVFAPHCFAHKDTCPAFALAPGLATACTAAKVPPGIGERRAGYDAAGWRAPGAAEATAEPVLAGVINKVPLWELWLDDYASLALTALASTAALQSLLDRDNHPLTLQGWPVYGAIAGWRQAAVLRLLQGKVELSAPSAALLHPSAFLAGSASGSLQPLDAPRVPHVLAEAATATAASSPRRHILAALLGLPTPPAALALPGSASASSTWWRDIDTLLGSRGGSGLATPPITAEAGTPTATPLAHLWSWLGGPGLLWTLGTERRALSRAVARVLARGGIPDVRRTLKLDLLLPMQPAAGAPSPAATPLAKKGTAPTANSSKSGPVLALPPGALPATIFDMIPVPAPPASGSEVATPRGLAGVAGALQHAELLRLLGPLLLVSAAPFGIRHFQLRARRAAAASPTAAVASAAAGAGATGAAKAPKRKIMKLFDAIADTVHGHGGGHGEPPPSPRQEAPGFAGPRVASIRLSTRDIEGFMVVDSEPVPVTFAAPEARLTVTSTSGGAAAPTAVTLQRAAAPPAPPAAAGLSPPRAYELLPEPVLMFQKPFTLPATTIDHHPVLPLYVRAGPGPVLAIISLTLQEAPGAGSGRRGGAGAAGALGSDAVMPVVAQHALHSVLSWTPLPPDTPCVEGSSPAGSVHGARGASRPGGGLLSGLLHAATHRDKESGSMSPAALPTGASEGTGLGLARVDTAVDLDEQILKARWSPDGRSLLACFASGVVRVWDAAMPDAPAAVLACSPRRSLAPSLLPPAAPPNTCIDFPVFAVTDAVTLTTEARVIAVGTAPLFHATSPFANPAGVGASAAAAAAAVAISGATARAAASTPSASRAAPGAAATGGAPPSLQRLLPGGSAYLLSIFDARVSEDVPVWRDFQVDASSVAAAIGGITALFYDDSSLHLVLGTALGAVLLYDVRQRRVRGVFAWGEEAGAATAAAGWVLVEGTGEEAVLDALVAAQCKAGPAWRAVTSLADHPSHAAVVVGWQDGGVGVLPLTVPAGGSGGGEATAAASLLAGMHGSPWAAQQGSSNASGPAAAAPVAPHHVASASGAGSRGAAPPRLLCGSPWATRGGTVAAAATEEFLVTAGQDGGLYGLYQIY